MTNSNARKSIKHTQAIPHQMRDLKNWVNWKFVERDGKLTKVPVRPGTTLSAKSNDPSTWGTFREAVLAAHASTDLGIGFEFGDSPYVFIDLDWKQHPGDDIPAMALKIMEWFSSYTETSPSGKGCHIIIEAELPEGYKSKVSLNSNVDIEVYATGRFSTITGDIMEHPFIERKSDELDGFLDFFMRKPEPTPPAPRTHVMPSQVTDLSMADIITKASQSNNFASLWSGDISAYGSDHSRADAALVQHLIWWTNGDIGRIDETFRCSGLYRPKWDRKHSSDGRTYGQMTIDRGLSMWDGQGYSGERNKLDLDSVIERYKSAADMLLEQGMHVIDGAGGHHAAKVAMRATWFALIQHIRDGHIARNEEGYYISFGGISTLSAFLGASRDQDVRIRLQYMAEIGFFKYSKRVAADQFAPVGAFIPEYPEDIGILKLLAAEIKGVDIKPVRKAPNRSKVSPIKQSQEPSSTPIMRAKLPSLRGIAYHIRMGATVAQVAHRSGLSRPTIKRQLDALVSIGLAETNGDVYVPNGDFEVAAKLELEYLPSWRARHIRKLEATIAWASQYRGCGNDPKRIASRSETLKLAQSRLERILDGEPISDVITRVAA